MKVKDFFRSITFRCIVVLAAIALLSGAILSLLNDILYVSDEEILQRTLNKIYVDEEVGAETVSLDSLDVENDYGTVKNVYAMDNGQYLVEATGKNGYKGGTVTAYTAFLAEDGALTGIYKVVITGNVSQSFISEMDAEYLAGYTTADASEIVSGGTEYFPTTPGRTDYVVTGATKVSDATNNAVNAAMYFLRTELLTAGGNTEQEA